MSQWNPQQPAPRPQPFQPQHQAQKPPKPPMSKGARIGWKILAGFVVFLIGWGLGAGSSSQPSATLSPAPTVTQTVAGPAGTEVTVTAPPVTVTKPAPPAKTVTQGPPEAASVMSEDGIYLVGVDIKPGQYKSGPDGDCYWARLKNTDGDLDSIIANHNGGNSVVTIRKTDKAFETARCGEWKKVG